MPLRWTPTIAAVLALLGCLSPAAPRGVRHSQTERLLANDPVLVVYEAPSALALQTVEGSLTLSSGLDEGTALRQRFGLAPPARGFAEAVVQTLREQPRYATSEFQVEALADAHTDRTPLRATPVLLAHVAEWRLVYDLSLRRPRRVLELWLTIRPARDVVAGRGAMALPGRVWRGACTWRGPDPDADTRSLERQRPRRTARASRRHSSGAEGASPSASSPSSSAERSRARMTAERCRVSA